MKCPTILYAVNLWLKPVSATGASLQSSSTGKLTAVQEQQQYIFTFQENSYCCIAVVKPGILGHTITPGDT